MVSPLMPVNLKKHTHRSVVFLFTKSLPCCCSHLPLSIQVAAAAVVQSPLPPWCGARFCLRLPCSFLSPPPLPAWFVLSPPPLLVSRPEPLAISKTALTLCHTYSDHPNGAASQLPYVWMRVFALYSSNSLVSCDNALSMAAMVGNTAAAKILVTKNYRLPYRLNRSELLQVFLAVLYSHRDTLLYLRGVTNLSIMPDHYLDRFVPMHIHDLVSAEFYDVALDLIKEYPQLAIMEDGDLLSPLTIMAKKALAFPSGTRFSLWERLVYSVLQVKLENPHRDPNNGDIETTSSHPLAHGMQVYVSICFRAVYQRLHFMLFEVLGFFVPRIRDKKLAHFQALQIVKSLCKEIALSHPDTTTAHFTQGAVFVGTIYDIPEVIEEIVGALPVALRSTCNDQSIFQFAVVNRSEKVFNLIYQMGDHRLRL